jgi:hypothetical protein
MRGRDVASSTYAFSGRQAGARLTTAAGTQIWMADPVCHKPEAN